MTAVMAVFAQTASFDVVQPRNVVEGNRFSLTFSLKNAQSDITPPKGPALDGCTLLYGPATSTMQSYQVVNGVASSSASTDFTFTYRADKAGTVTVPGRHRHGRRQETHLASGHVHRPAARQDPARRIGRQSGYQPASAPAGR